MQSRRIFAAWAIGAGVASALAQQPGPFADGDPQRGHALVDKDCHECHVRLFGDQNRIYTRHDAGTAALADRRIQHAARQRLFPRR